IRAASEAPRVTGAHLCVADRAASGVKTAEAQGRTDIGEPPAQFLMIEATDAAALADLAPEAALLAAGAMQITRGTYILEYTRNKTAWN
ncbi:MAG: hypothetical protein NT133_00615, partial [Alphaproteobacteria bacterium]|nr:hypothetical protein [Alphaproteobacteria bacterium]